MRKFFARSYRFVTVPTDPATPAASVEAPTQTQTPKKGKGGKKAPATDATPVEGQAPATDPVVKAKGPNDLSAAEARCLAVMADGYGRLNCEIYSVTTDVLGCGTKTGGSAGLVGRGFLVVMPIEAQEGRRGGNAYFITAAGRAALAGQDDVPALTEKACAMEQAAKERFLAKRTKKAAEAAAMKAANVVAVPTTPAPEATATEAPATAS